MQLVWTTLNNIKDYIKIFFLFLVKLMCTLHLQEITTNVIQISARHFEYLTYSIGFV